MKIRLRNDLYARGCDRQAVRSKTEVAAKAGLSYPTVLELTTGQHGSTTYAMLGAYLEAIGYTPSALRGVKFGEIFEVE
jgi:transcriptional regulator with XRE-family HTH domain